MIALSQWTWGFLSATAVDLSILLLLWIRESSK